MRRLGKKKSTFDKIYGISKQAVKSDYFDEKAYKRSVGKRLHELENEGKAEYEPFPELLQDTFSSLYKFHPKLRSTFEMEKQFVFNLELMKKIVTHPKWKELRVHTKLDEITSTIGTQYLGKELREMIKEVKEQMDALAKAQEAAEKATELEGEEGEEEEEGKRGNEEEGKKGKSKQQLTLEEAKKKLEEERKNFEKKMEDKKLRQSIGQMMQKVQDKVTETKELIENWGLEQDPTFTHSDYREKMELVEELRNSDKLKKIAELAGRFKHIALSVQREKVKRGIDEVYTISPGNKIERVLPSELMSLTDPNLEMNFYKKFIENNLLTYALRGKEKKQRGPIIICLDSSGSMNGIAEIWSKAVAIAILEVARVQKRDFAAIHFDGTSNPNQLKINIFLKSEPFRIKNLIDFCTYYSGGGTNFEAPLKRAQIFAESCKEDWLRASIIFVSDGEAPIGDNFRDQFNNWRKQRKVKVISILIDTYYNTDVSLKEFSDEVHKLSSIKVDSNPLALTIFTNLL